MSRVNKTPPPVFSKYLESFGASHDGSVPRLIYNKKNNQIVGNLTGKSKKIHLEKIYSKLFKYLDSNAPIQVSQVDALYLENLKGMITDQTLKYKEKHSGPWGNVVMLWRKIFRGDVDKLSQKLLDKVDVLQNSHVPSFSSYLSAIAPLTPLDVSVLLDSNFPHLVYSQQKGELECDLTGKKPENIDLENTYMILLNYLNKNSPEHVSQLDKLHLGTLKGIITNQTHAYKETHSGDIDKLGYINRISDDLLDKIDDLETRPLPLKNVKEADEVKATLDPMRKEFQSMQDRFVKTMDAAAENIKILTRLCKEKGVHDPDELAEFDIVFEKLSISAHKIQNLVNLALNEATDISKSESLAKIYKTDTYQEYVRDATRAAQAYEETLKDLIADLANNHIFAHSDIVGLNLFGQPADDLAGGFVYSANDRIKATIPNCFAPPMQHIMRHAMLMETLEKNTPYDADEYDLVLEGAIQAKQGAGCMNFLL